MSLFQQLQLRQQQGRPIRVGLIGAGKFGSMYLSQIPRTPGVHLMGIADLSPDRARANLKLVGWREDITRARANEKLAAQYGLRAEIQNPLTGKPIGMRAFQDAREAPPTERKPIAKQGCSEWSAGLHYHGQPSSTRRRGACTAIQ